METARPQRTRNSRWSRDPVPSQAGTPRAIYPTDRDIAIFSLLVRYRYLPSDTIHAFVGGNAKALLHRLSLLSRKPNLYLSRPQQQRQNAAANYRPLIYQLDQRGSQVLQERGLPFLSKSLHHNFAHELMVAQIMASIELGTRVNHAIRLITCSEILAHERTPLATRQSSTPTAIAVAYTYRGEQRHDDVYADAQPFGLERQIDGKPSYLFFPGIEADCATEPIDASDAARSSIAKKFAAYLAIAEQGLHRSHFGFPNFFVPFITTTAARQHSMMELLARMTGRRGSKIILLKTFPSFTSVERAPAAPGHVLTAPWQRVGNPPLCLDR
jgi:hypothetical protein